MSGRDLNPSNCRILVIGAGLAGLSAAQHLYNNGFENLTVLEAMDRIGGRVLTTKFGGDVSTIVEEGANWIHGAASNNSLFTLANQLDILPGELIRLNRMEGFCYKSNGVALERELVDKLFERFMIWEDDAPATTDVNSRMNLEDHLRRRLNEYLADGGVENEEDVRCAFNCIMNYCSFHNGGFVKEFPAHDVLGYNDIPGGNIKVPSGMSNIISGLIRSLPKKVIKLRSAVKQVVWNRYECQVECDDGSRHLADHVICTSSLGYLKQHADGMFQPALPKEKVAAIKTIPFGKVNKIFLEWEKPFWRKGAGSIKLAWSDDELKNLSQKSWYKMIFSFDEVLNNPNVLVAWISGNAAHTMESLTEDEICQTVTHIIRKFLNNPAIPTPKRALRTKWCSDPYTLGSYSYRNCMTQKRHIEDLREPLRLAEMPRVLFAGEATDLPGYSTMHGARDSGLREAERLIAYYGLRDNMSNL